MRHGALLARFCSVGPFLEPNGLPKEWKISVRRWSYFEGWPGHLFEVNGVQMELNGGSWGSPGRSPGRANGGKREHVRM